MAPSAPLKANLPEGKCSPVLCVSRSRAAPNHGASPHTPLLGIIKEECGESVVLSRFAMFLYCAGGIFLCPVKQQVFVFMISPIAIEITGGW